MIATRMGSLSKTASGPTVQKFLHDPLHILAFFPFPVRLLPRLFSLLILLYFSASIQSSHIQIFQQGEQEARNLRHFIISAYKKSVFSVPLWADTLFYSAKILYEFFS